MHARIEVDYEDRSSKFRIGPFDYERQYFHLYRQRFAEMEPLLRTAALSKWGEDRVVRKVCDLSEEQEESCIVVGIMLKQQSHKPSILREVAEENELAPQPPRLHYADAADKLMLEDDKQVVRMCGNIDISQMATGIVCAILGCVEQDGFLEVEEVLFYEAGPQRSLLPWTGGTRRLLILTSGLNQVESDNFADALDLFQHWLAGNIAAAQNDMKNGNNQRQAIRLIIAGNSVRIAEQKVRKPGFLNRMKTLNNDTVAAVIQLDEWFSAWSRLLPIDLMPGAHDPASAMLPQQPFHRCMFPRSAQHASFRGVTNPYECRINNATIVVGTSGQNVADLLRCTQIDEELEALRSTLVWSHIVPTAPDTLVAFPHVEHDPFILQECPHIYFAGNCSKFATAMHSPSNPRLSATVATRLVCVPSFARTRSIAVVDIDSLECYEVSFEASTTTS